MSDTTEAVRERTFTWNAPMDTARSIVGRDPMTWLSDMMAGKIPAPPAARLLDFSIESVEEGRVVFGMRTHEWMANPAGVIHGGMSATLLDTVMTLAVVSKIPPEKMCTTIDLQVRFLRPLFPNGEKVTGEGVAVHVGTNFGTAEGRIHDAKGRLIAHGTASLAIVDALAQKPR
jgi:uncharacterized protein (TIGR00369 family)